MNLARSIIFDAIIKLCATVMFILRFIVVPVMLVILVAEGVSCLYFVLDGQTLGITHPRRALSLMDRETALGLTIITVLMDLILWRIFLFPPREWWKPRSRPRRPPRPPPNEPPYWPPPGGFSGPPGSAPVLRPPGRPPPHLSATAEIPAETER